MVPASILFGASQLVSMVHGVKSVLLPKCNLSESLIFELGLILFHLLTVINTLWCQSVSVHGTRREECATTKM